MAEPSALGAAVVIAGCGRWTQARRPQFQWIDLPDTRPLHRPAHIGTSMTAQSLNSATAPGGESSVTQAGSLLLLVGHDGSLGLRAVEGSGLGSEVGPNPEVASQVASQVGWTAC